ncbi:MAG TPA: RNA polymerase sigma factor [Candidatus Binataceae bacterium]|nr:RNA polymerase sigma factor [Candidatus Binataceae bacterium]
MANDQLPALRQKHSASIAAAFQRARSVFPEIDEGAFAEALASSVGGWTAKLPASASGLEIADHIRSLHVEDFALALLCRRGDSRAWEKLIDEHRSALYVSARALTRDEAVARELADGLWAELYGLGDTAGPRRSLLEYFHGRSSLKTWLRAVLAQRFIDYRRSLARDKRFGTATENEAEVAAADDGPPDPTRVPYLQAFNQALSASIAQLDARERVRLNLYYVQDLTLKEIGRLMNEYESSVSRRLLRSRKRLRASVEQALRRDHNFDGEQIRLCYAYAMESWSADIGRLFAEK